MRLSKSRGLVLEARDNAIKRKVNNKMKREELIQDLKSFLISELKLGKKAGDIKDDAALFGAEGLGIDSLDALQLGVASEQRYGIKIPIDSDEGKAALSSVNALADFILQAQGK